jgi:hypothetical protein
MKKIFIIIVLMTVCRISFAQGIQSSHTVTAADLEGKSWSNKYYQITFLSDGSFKYYDWNSLKQTGKWYVNTAGTIFYIFDDGLVPTCSNTCYISSTQLIFITHSNMNISGIFTSSSLSKVDVLTKENNTVSSVKYYNTEGISVDKSTKGLKISKTTYQNGNVETKKSY